MARSEEASSMPATRPSLIPVLVVIHSSVVSTIFSRSKFVSTLAGTYEPVPMIWMADLFGIRLNSELDFGRIFGKSAFRVMFLDFVLDEAIGIVLHELTRDANGVGDGFLVRLAMADDADPVNPHERSPAVLRVIGFALDLLQGVLHEESAQFGQ